MTVSMLAKAFFEKVLGNDTGLGQAVHTLLYLTVNVAIVGGFATEIVVLDYASGMLAMRRRMYLFIGVFM